MGSKKSFKINSTSLADTVSFGSKIGRCLRGGEFIELISDVGGGKTSLVRGMALGIGSSDQVQSPTFTIQRIYKGENCDLHHFDFYRIQDPGVLSELVGESLGDEAAAVVIEWSGAVSEALPKQRLRIEIAVIDENRRQFTLIATGDRHQGIIEALA